MGTDKELSDLLDFSMVSGGPSWAPPLPQRGLLGKRLRPGVPHSSRAGPEWGGWRGLAGVGGWLGELGCIGCGEAVALVFRSGEWV